jgi:hypothetical protein
MRVKTAVIWLIPVILLVQYVLMYHIIGKIWFPTKGNLEPMEAAAHWQWYVMFVSRQIEIVILSMIAFLHFKGTRNFGIGLGILVMSGIELIGEILDINQKGNLYDSLWLVMIGAALFYGLGKRK